MCFLSVRHYRMRRACALIYNMESVLVDTIARVAEWEMAHAHWEKTITIRIIIRISMLLHPNWIYATHGYIQLTICER